MKVLLSWTEYLEAIFTGALRGFVNIWKGSQAAYGFKKSQDRWGVSIEGACAEKLVAKALGLYWIGTLPGRDNGGDVGNYGVRSTPREDGDLVLHPEDSDERIFILVVGESPLQQIAGWIKAADGKAVGEFRTPYPDRPKAYWVPQKFLQPIEKLIKEK